MMRLRDARTLGEDHQQLKRQQRQKAEEDYALSKDRATSVTSGVWWSHRCSST